VRYLMIAALVSVSLGAFAVPATLAQQYNPELYSGMRWRLIGPFRGGRVTSVAGVLGQTSVYYTGTPQGGIWKTNDGGQVWRPIFDRENVPSIGALAVAASNPSVIYAGTGEQLPGNGVYKSTDAGASWKNVGLQEARCSGSILVDPHNPDLVLTGAYSGLSSAAQGIFKSVDGGKTWKQVLKEEGFAAIDMCLAPDNPRVVYAALSGPPPSAGARGVAAIYVSTDEGSSWRSVALPSLTQAGTAPGQQSPNPGRIGVAVAPGSEGRSVYSIMNQGLFRSDDAGANWRRTTTDPRIVGSPYFSRIFVDPHNADIVYVPQTSLYRSTDGGRTFDSFAGAPSGDDYHVMWINPQDSRVMIAGVDQGAVISMNGGETWSSWYNQPTGQFYHVSTDDAFPYNVYAAQQDSGTAAVASRSDYGEITYRDWLPVGGFEIGYIAADPTNPAIVYSGGWYGTIVRLDRVTGQQATVFLPGTRYRVAGEVPIAFSPHQPHTLYLGSQYLLKTTDEGMTWQVMSPDLTKKPGPEPASAATGRRRRSDVIMTLAPSPVEAGQIWIGTGNGLVQLTRDNGATWQDVSPPSLAGAATILEASHHDAGTAYATAIRFGDSKPHVYRTRDYGKTWQDIAAALPKTSIARVVREDPVRRGLLYAGTENGIYVSFDDGAHWQSLQLNLPAASVRDLAVHGDDLVAATYGRALWILDDLTPLRQVDDKVKDAEAYLFDPQAAIRFRWDVNQDTPLPPETPAGANPPDGAILDYYLKSAPAGDITLDIYEESPRRESDSGLPQGGSDEHLVRHYSSAAAPPGPAFPNAPEYWFAPPEVLPKKPGMNRFVWDLRYPHPLRLPYNYYGFLIDYTEYTLADHAVPGQTPRYQPQGPLAVPGTYSVVLTVGGRQLKRVLTVKADPRIRASQSDLKEQFDLERGISEQMAASFHAYRQIEALRAALSDREKRLAEQQAEDGRGQGSPITTRIHELDLALGKLATGTNPDPGFGPINRDLTRLATMAQSADVRPASPLLESAGELCQALNRNLASWRQVNAQDLPSLNSVLKERGLDPLPIVEASSSPSCRSR
jgi:photosystem II stability/assembly factor-like uncharacterized protein